MILPTIFKNKFYIEFKTLNKLKLILRDIEDKKKKFLKYWIFAKHEKIRWLFSSKEKKKFDISFSKIISLQSRVKGCLEYVGPLTPARTKNQELAIIQNYNMESEETIGKYKLVEYSLILRQLLKFESHITPFSLKRKAMAKTIKIIGIFLASNPKNETNTRAIYCLPLREKHEGNTRKKQKKA